MRFVNVALRTGLLLAGMLCGSLQAAAPPVPTVSPDAKADAPKRIYVTRRLTGAPPIIDGKLDDACWAQGEWAGNYTQREPREGAVPSEPTELKILYDDRYLYVAIRAFDSKMATQPRILGQRDELTGDMVGITFDSFFNHRTAFEFDVTSGGSKIDLILRNDASIDQSWNAIWDVKVSADARGWYAEYRIPLSQLRYSRKAEQVWGLHSWRWIRRNQEESDWHLIPMDHHGFVYSMGELHGIENIPASRRLEFLPYVVGKYKTRERETGNPYRDGPTSTVEGGFDAKIGVSSDFTLDVTVNPDFGQVEVDPSQVNLTAFETFFPERRPFFLEGKSIFDFALDDDLSFYSRRIGHAPSLSPLGVGFVDTPESTRILAAAKLTGRTSSGFSLGILDSVTERTEARLFDPSGHEVRSVAEPQSQLFVARAQNDFDQGNTSVGGIVTAVQRQGSEAELRYLPRQSIMAGADLLHQWSQRTYYIEAKALATQVKGSTEAMRTLMTNAVHNFQRPDADHVEVDDARVLSGNAGRVRIGKGSGVLRYYAGGSWRSPGVEFNDIGYLKNADWIEATSQIQYYNTHPTRLLRRRELRLRQSSIYDYSGETLRHSVRVDGELAGVKNWYVWSRIGMETRRLDTRVLRGGPALRLPTTLQYNFYGETDNALPLQFKLDADYFYAPDDGSHVFDIGPGVGRKIGDRLRVDLKISYEHNAEVSQYAGETVLTRGPGYLVGRMDQKTIASELRIQATFSPTLSLVYFGGPFASVGRFDDFKLVTRPRAARARDRFSPVVSTPSGGDYRGQVGAETFTFSNPNFTWRELKSNLVLRWEFRPGSNLYCVWSQNRGDSRNLGEFTGSNEYRRLFQRHPDNTFLVKVSYWFSL